MGNTFRNKSNLVNRRLKLVWVNGKYFISGKSSRTGPFFTVNDAMTFHRQNRGRGQGRGSVAAVLSSWL